MTSHDRKNNSDEEDSRYKTLSLKNITIPLLNLLDLSTYMRLKVKIHFRKQNTLTLFFMYIISSENGSTKRTVIQQNKSTHGLTFCTMDSVLYNTEITMQSCIYTVLQF